MKFDGVLFHYCVLAKCEHLTHYVIPSDQVDRLDGARYPACHAYPRGIPQDIRRGIDHHRKVRDDQEGDWTYTRSKKITDDGTGNIVVLPPEEITATTRGE